MFTPLPGRLSLGVPPESVVAIIESINSPNISIPELGTEPTKAFLVGVATPAGGYGIFCYLLFQDTNRPIIYISNPPEVSFEQYGILESDAIQFAESMGFMLDNTNFRAQPADVQQRMMAELPFFRDQHPHRRGTQPVLQGVGQQSDSLLVARLLSSF
ncbi:MAG TPA: hypothetical protein VGO62_13980 [Myxococcota bacterium]|jgi:hypothetical protein